MDGKLIKKTDIILFILKLLHQETTPGVANCFNLLFYKKISTIKYKTKGEV